MGSNGLMLMMVIVLVVVEVAGAFIDSWAMNLQKKMQKIPKEMPDFPKGNPDFLNGNLNFPKGMSSFSREMSVFPRKIPDFTKEMPHFARRMPDLPKRDSKKLKEKLNFLKGLPGFPEEMSIFPKEIPDFSKEMSNFSKNMENFPSELEKDFANAVPSNFLNIDIFKSSFAGHVDNMMLKTNLAGTVGLSEIHSVMPEVKELATCQGASMLEAAKRVFPQARGMLRAPSMMRLPTEVCRNFLPETCSLGVRQACTFASSKYRSLDGSCNNLNHAKRGAAMTNYKRLLPPAYDDDLDSMRGGDGRLPQPRRLSAALQALGPDRNRNQKPLSHLFMQWGQFVAHDLAFTALSQPKDCCKGHRLKPRTPTEGCQAMNVTDDPVFSAARRTCFFFVRSLVGGKECELGPRQQVNQMSHYLDASGVYGAGDRESRNLRTMSSGKLKVSMPQPGVLPLLPDNGNSFLAGDPRLIITPFLTSLNTLWVRVHNSIADKLQNLNPSWNDENLYQESRRVVAALIQHITYKEYLPLVLGKAMMDEKNLNILKKDHLQTYQPLHDATNANAFVAAAFRFGHTMVGGKFKLPKRKPMTLLASFSEAKSVKNAGTRPSDFLEGMANTLSDTLDTWFTPHFHNSFAATPSSEIGFDIGAISIKRGRDHGLPGYNRWRRKCGLQPFMTFDSMSQVMRKGDINVFKRMYKSVEDIDLYPAGLAERGQNSLLGPTFSCIVAQQFHDLRHGDRFWYENNQHLDHPFSTRQLAAIRAVGLASILCEHTTISSLQRNPFLIPNPGSNKRVPCSRHCKLDLSTWKDTTTSTKPHDNPVLDLSDTNNLFPTLPFGLKLSEKRQILKFNTRTNPSSLNPFSGDNIFSELEKSFKNPFTVRSADRNGFKTLSPFSKKRIVSPLDNVFPKSFDPFSGGSDIEKLAQTFFPSPHKGK